jgi:hypothetical protein
VRISCLAISLSLFAAIVSATTVVPVSVEQLTQESSVIVEGKAGESWSKWNSQHSLIFTYTRFQVTRTLKGQLPADIVVRQPGGSAEGYIQKIPGVRHWLNGEQAVLFLRPNQTADGSLDVTGLMQGNFAVRKSATGETVVSNGVSGVSSYLVESHQVTSYQGTSMRLTDLEARVQKAVQQ